MDPTLNLAMLALRELLVDREADPARSVRMDIDRQASLDRLDGDDRQLVIAYHSGGIMVGLLTQADIEADIANMGEPEIDLRTPGGRMVVGKPVDDDPPRQRGSDLVREIRAKGHEA